MKLRKRALVRQAWAVVDRYDAQTYLGLEDIYRSKSGALEAARDDIRRGYTVNGRLSVVRITFAVATEIEVT